LRLLFNSLFSISATIYVKSMEYFADMNAVWDAWVPEGYAPARACV
jgi:enamine deaminase RidA (YjgF/YER057c/UK114 family)